MHAEKSLKAVNENLEQIFSVYLSGIITKDLIEKEIKSMFSKGMDQAEIQFGMNFMYNAMKINFLTNYTFDLIQDMTKEVAADLRQELSRAIMNLESISQIKERVKKVMEVTEVRARMIARTEANRALNEGHLEGAIQSGLKLKKEVVAKIDGRTSEICKHLDGKVVNMGEKFKYKDKEWNLPPFHVNCRSRVIYIQE